MFEQQRDEEHRGQGAQLAAGGGHARTGAAVGDGVDLGRQDEGDQVGSGVEEEFEDREACDGAPQRQVVAVGEQQHAESGGAEQEAPALEPHVADASEQQQTQDEAREDEEVDDGRKLDRTDQAGVGVAGVRAPSPEREDEHREEDADARRRRLRRPRAGR